MVDWIVYQALFFVFYCFYILVMSNKLIVLLFVFCCCEAHCRVCLTDILTLALTLVLISLTNI